MDKIYTNDTLRGDGTLLNKLSIAGIAKTGHYSPVDEMHVLSSGEILETPSKVGYRILIKMPLDRYGRLYTDEELEAISQKLADENSEWRIPSKEDWDELFNAFECPEDRNHDSDELDTCLGHIAGKALKSELIWNDTIESEGVDQVYMGVLPTHRNIYSSFWTTTKQGDKYYIKEFTDDCDGVKQNLFDDEVENFAITRYPAIRLVKDYTGENYNMSENILGDEYLTTLIINPHDDVEYKKIWTIVNLRYTGDQVDGYVESEWDNDSFERRYVYSIYEWNGTDFDKTIMLDGECVSVKNGDEEPKTYMVFRDLLIDMDHKLDEFKSATTVTISELSASTQSIEDRLFILKTNVSIKDKIETLFGAGSASILTEFILSVLEGIEGEIKIKRLEDGRIKFGFADDAVFGQID